MVERGGSPRGYVSSLRAVPLLQHMDKPLSHLYMWRSLPQCLLCSVGAEQSVEVELDARVDGERTVFAGEEVEGVVILTNPLATPVVVSWCRQVVPGSSFIPNICPPVAYLCQLHVLLRLCTHSTNGLSVVNATSSPLNRAEQPASNAQLYTVRTCTADVRLHASSGLTSFLRRAMHGHLRQLRLLRSPQHMVCYSCVTFCTRHHFSHGACVTRCCDLPIRTSSLRAALLLRCFDATGDKGVVIFETEATVLCCDVELDAGQSVSCELPLLLASP